MLKILTTQQIKELDEYTIRHEPIASIDLMERACHAFVDWFTQYYDGRKKVAVACGTGNNGGDGLGIARLLKEWNYTVTVFVLNGAVPQSDDFKKNLERLKGILDVQHIANSAKDLSLNNFEIIIDAIFGSGLSRPPSGIYAEAIESINNSKAVRIAVDIPSGLFADAPSSGPIIRAHYTITFELPKLSFFFPESYAFTGEWITTSIGLDKQFIKNAKSHHHLVRHSDARKLVKPRGKFDHKGNFGHALLIAGSYGKTGAAILASRAALRAGLGLLTVRVPRCGYDIIQTAVPEAMADVDPHEEYFSQCPDLSRYNIVGIGPGLGLEAASSKAFAVLMERFRKPMVIDADALNMISTSRELRDMIPSGSILTPHPKEFERLAGPSPNSFERLEKQVQVSRELNSIVILKGAFSSICSPDGNVYFNSTGNPGMATGGTGDALTGILVGLLAQNYESSEAAILGTFLHGLAGDLARNEKGIHSLMASDLVECLPAAFLRLNPK